MISATATERLAAYFRSGWAFLIPYLVAYLLYAWLRWPVNPGGALATGPQTPDPSTQTLVPSLLHLYWALHAIHLILGIVALRSWWRSRDSLAGVTSGPRSQVSGFYPLLPWACLALVFWIPGAYLEWPSDPWEHLRRINEWRALDTVTAHSAWLKSSYFLPYSLTRHLTGLGQLDWLNLYYTAACLLLSWQYYRLARAVGLGARASFVFVLLNALTFGNNIFSFYRYYGLSSSIFAQIGAVALTRLALESVTLGRSFNVRCSLKLAVAAVAATALTACNHVQGLGIAGIGVLAVTVWRLIEWKRVMIAWLVLAAVLASFATVMWFPRHPALDDIYRAQNWLTRWYGFALFSPSAAAFTRSLQILGVFGAFSLPLGLWLILRKNHVVGWLTIMPIVVLSLPCFALPFAHVLASLTKVENIVTFHRMFLALPAGLALTTCFLARMDSSPSFAPLVSGKSQTRWTGLALARGLPLPLALIILSSSLPYNRFWHAIQITPDDLSLRHFVAIATLEHQHLAAKDGTLTIAAYLGAQVIETFAPPPNAAQHRRIYSPIRPAEIERQMQWLHQLAPSPGPEKLKPRSPTPGVAKIFQLQPKLETPRLLADLAAPATPWLRLGGKQPEVTSSGQNVQVGNPTGSASYAFADKLIPVGLGSRYRINTTIKQIAGPPAVNYLAVAWYDKSGNLLRADRTTPDGAGAPMGWSNGAFSYYGLIRETAPPKWVKYSIEFGFGEKAAIPSNASFIRIGALLNHRSTPAARIVLRDITFWELPDYTHYLVIIPNLHHLTSHASIAARLSGHWPAQRVSTVHAGTKELRFHLP